MISKDRQEARRRRQRRVRKRIRGTDERPRLCVFRSNRHIYAQVISDERGVTLAAASSLSPELRGEIRGLTRETAAKVGALVAKRCLEKGIEKVVFDRNGFRYHGRVQALADAAREAGLKF
ncbi:MAG: 50S ribosomal protein L18 [Candidatus Binatia bacterium]|nr:MAG: 50S ribosomal protein L18 [Candidatus Binatia bacterium]